MKLVLGLNMTQWQNCFTHFNYIFDGNHVGNDVI